MTSPGLEDALTDPRTEIEARYIKTCAAADAILAVMTMEFGRLMLEGPDEEITITMCGHSVSMPAHYFNRLYNATDLHWQTVAANSLSRAIFGAQDNAK